MNWENTLWDMLCQIYMALGGDCKDLPKPLSQAIVVLDAYFQQRGLPTFPTEQDKQAFLDLLADVHAHLSLPGNSLSQASQAQLLDLLNELQAAADAQNP